MKDIDQHMENLIVELIADAGAKVREATLRGDIFSNTGIRPVWPPTHFISKHLQESAHVLIAVDVAEKVEQEKTGRVITRRTFIRVTTGYNGTDKGLRPVGPTPRREKSISEVIILTYPPRTSPLGRISTKRFLNRRFLNR